MKDKSPLFKRVVAIISAIPKGKVVTYGQVSQMAAAPGCARHVSYILSSSSKKYKLPWHRVINSSGKVSGHQNSQRQISLLEKEGVAFEIAKIDLDEYAWIPKKAELKKLLKNIPEHISVFKREE